MKKTFLALSILIVFVSVFISSIQINPVSAQVTTIIPSVKRPSLGNTTSPTHTPTGASTPISILTVIPQFEDFWKTRIEIPFDVKHWKIHETPDEENSSVEYFRNVVFDMNGFAWVNTANGFWKIKDGKITEIKCSDMYGGKQLLYYYPVPDPITGKNKMYGEVIPPCKIHQNTKSIIADNANNIWIIMENYFPETVFYGNEQVGWKHFQFSGKVETIALDREGAVWVAYHKDDGVINLAYRKNRKWYQMTIPVFNEKPGWVGSISFDIDNSLWLYTSEGIIKRQQDEWINISEMTPELQTHCLQGGQSLLTSDSQGEIWGIAEDCVIHWNGNAWDEYKVSSSYPNRLGDVVVDQNGKVWSGNGFLKDEKNYYFDSEKLWFLNDLAVSPDNSIWYATGQYLLIYDNKQDLP